MYNKAGHKNRGAEGHPRLRPKQTAVSGHLEPDPGNAGVGSLTPTVITLLRLHVCCRRFLVFMLHFLRSGNYVQNLFQNPHTGRVRPDDCPWHRAGKHQNFRDAQRRFHHPIEYAALHYDFLPPRREVGAIYRLGQQPAADAAGLLRTPGPRPAAAGGDDSAGLCAGLYPAGAGLCHRKAVPESPRRRGRRHGGRLLHPLYVQLPVRRADLGQPERRSARLDVQPDLQRQLHAAGDHPDDDCGRAVL